MHKINLTLAAFVLIAMSAFVTTTMTSCGGKANEENTDSTKKDTAAAYTIAPELQTLLAKFKEYQEWPYKADTTLLNMDGKMIGDSLGSADLALLNKSWFKHDLINGIEWELGAFNKIDSIKAAGKYKEYCENLDLGDTKKANAYAVHKLMLNNDTWVIVWALRNSSYEACPYSTTSALYFTIIYKGQVGESFVMAENTSAGDPPAQMQKEVSSTLDKEGNLILDTKEESSDDGEQLETRKNHFEFKLANGKIEKGKEEIGKPVVTKIAQE